MVISKAMIEQKGSSYRKQPGKGANMRIRYILTNVIVISLSIAFLVHFGLIAHYGQIVISEPYPVILALEVIGLIGLIVFAFLNLLR